MSTGYQINDQHATHFLTFTIVDWVDVFTRKTYKDIITDNLGFYKQQHGLEIYGFVVMTNHIHLIARSSMGKLSASIRDFKKYTANKILETIEKEPESRREWMLHRFEWNASQHKRNSNYQVWTHENHAEEIQTKPFFIQKLNYIHQNPVRAGWVEREEDYIYSSARSLYNNEAIFFQLSDWYD